jgi:aspartate-semialdehyde dehydrogenase
MSGIVVAVVGAASEVGREIPAVLEARGIEVADLRLYDTTDEADADSEASDEPLLPAEAIDFEGVEVAFLCGPAAQTREFAERAIESGARVIDLTETLIAADVPLVVPEVNADAVEEGIGRGVYACPTPGATALAVVLKPLADAAELRRVAVTAFEPTSTAGTPGVDELAQQSRQLLTGESAEAKVFPQRVAFNLIPKVGDFAVGGRTRAEWEIERQTRQILSLADLPLIVTCVQTPTFYGQAYSILVETEQPLDLEAARAVLRAAPGVLLADDDEYPTLADVVGSDATHIGRLRDDPTVPHGLAMWVVIDGLRKGGATNAVQIAELALRARG